MLAHFSPYCFKKWLGVQGGLSSVAESLLLVYKNFLEPVGVQIL